MPPQARSAARATTLFAVLLGSCADATPRTDALPAPQESFWGALADLCDQAFEGRLIEAPAGDTSFAGRRLVMHVRECTPAEIRIPFHVGENRSRTWVVSRAERGLRLKHDHRHEDGSEDPITQYGGDAPDAGTAQLQEFRADSATAALIPAAATNVWSIEVVPGRTFAYALRREGTDRRFRIEFDLSRPVPPPPAPWGRATTDSAR
jgi:hypothetical protein